MEESWSSGVAQQNLRGDFIHPETLCKIAAVLKDAMRASEGLLQASMQVDAGWSQSGIQTITRLGNSEGLEKRSDRAAHFWQTVLQAS